MTVELDAVMHGFRRALPSVERHGANVLLTRARLCDFQRSLGPADCPKPHELDEASRDLDSEGWRRLDLLVGVAPLLTKAIQRSHELDPEPGQIWRDAFVGLALDMPLHTIVLLRESHPRREELARNWLLRLGIPIDGETPERSLERLERLDYARLMAAADAARDAADDRLQYLRKLQEKADLYAARDKY